jgi:hypothetical protein
VLRVRYADANQTWLYVDPARGAIVQRTDDTRRLRRWLYQGLHSLDFPSLYYKRPLWDIVVIVLSIGGLALSATTLVPAWRRLRRNVRLATSWSHQAPGTTHQAPGPKHQAPSTRHQAPALKAASRRLL